MQHLVIKIANFFGNGEEIEKKQSVCIPENVFFV
jgi:hypothetical protein